MRTVFFGGKSGTNNGAARVLRYVHRRDKAEHGSRTKPLYKPHRVDARSTTNLHEMRIKYQQQDPVRNDPRYSEYNRQMGYDLAEDESILRLNHYWCERLKNGQNGLVEDDSIREVMARLPKD